MVAEKNGQERLYREKKQPLGGSFALARKVKLGGRCRLKSRLLYPLHTRQKWTDLGRRHVGTQPSASRGVGFY